MKVRYSYLGQQFADPDPILAEIKRLVATGDFTLGKPVGEFEKRFADLIGVKHAIGVGSGTDALKLSLKAVGIGRGPDVATLPGSKIHDEILPRDTSSKTRPSSGIDVRRPTNNAGGLEGGVTNGEDVRVTI